MNGRHRNQRPVEGRLAGLRGVEEVLEIIEKDHLGCSEELHVDDDVDLEEFSLHVERS